jgi:diguanylate cyclase (GGDEF)-like protein/PAS domain S-box-containing protein
MGIAHLQYSLLLFYSAVMLLVVGVGTWTYRHERTSRNFLCFLLALEIWTVGFALEINSPTLEGKIFWANVQYLGLTTLPLSWLATIISYTGLGNIFGKALPLLQIGLLGTNLVIWTDPWHHWFRIAPALDVTSASFAILVNDYGLWFYLFVALAYIPFLFSFVLLAHAYRAGKKVIRWQIILLFLSVGVPLTVNLLYTLGITPMPNFNLTPMLFGLSATVIGTGLFRLRLFDLLPVAYDVVFENMNDGAIVLDYQNRVVNINPAARAIIHSSLESSIIGLPFAEATENTPEILARLETLEEGRVEVEIQAEAPQYFDMSISPIKAKDGDALGRVVIFRDVTERVRLFEEVKRLAVLDSLTGTYNRRYFFDALAQELIRAHRYHRPVGLIMLDIDHFKLVNDTYGHLVGDVILKEVVNCCRINLRVLDLIGRYGGEEFIILLPETPLKQTGEAAERLRALIAGQVFQAPPYAVSITVSIGATSLSAGESITPDQFVAFVDNKLYQAKASGRNYVVCTALEL